MEYLKRFILSRKFVKDFVQLDREKVYRDAFKHAYDDLKETNMEDIDGKAEAKAIAKLDAMLSNVDLTSVVKLSQTGIISIGERQPDKQELLNLKSEAEMIASTNLWKYLVNSPKELAQRAMFRDGDSIDNFKKGRSMLYLLSTQENIVGIFKSLK